ncbi:hypothetical protein ACWY4P_06065 [Streptomyces sp. LZ34]
MSEGTAERQRIMNRVHDRLDAFVRLARPDLLLASAAERDVTLLLDFARPRNLDRGSAEDAEFQHAALELAAWFHRLRVRMKIAADESPAEDDPDAEMAARLFTVLARADPHRAPRFLKPLVDQLDQLGQLDQQQRRTEGGGAAAADGPPGPQVDRAAAAFQSAESRQDVEALTWSIAACRRTVEDTEPGTPAYVSDLSMLCAALRTRSQTLGGERDAQEAVEIGRRAVAEARVVGAHLTQCLNHLVLALTYRGALTGRAEDHDEAIALGREAITGLESGADPQDRRMLPTLYSNQVNAALSRYGRGGSPADLEEAVAAGRRGLELERELTGAQDPGSLTNLCLAYLERYGARGDDADLAGSLEAGRRAVEAASPGYPVRARALNNLALAMIQRVRRTLDPRDLEETIRVAEESVRLSAEGSIESALRAANLAELLAWRFQEGRDRADIDRAVELLRGGIEIAPFGHPKRDEFRFQLANVLRERFQALRQLEDAQEFTVLLGELRRRGGSLPGLDSLSL